MSGICVYSNHLLLYLTQDPNQSLEICKQFPSSEYSVQMTDEPEYTQKEILLFVGLQIFEHRSVLRMIVIHTRHLIFCISGKEEDNEVPRINRINR